MTCRVQELLRWSEVGVRNHVKLRLRLRGSGDEMLSLSSLTVLIRNEKRKVQWHRDILRDRPTCLSEN